ncbi:NAD(P)/FAD-dependent oxidoreductase [Bradyrhizobium sp. Arg314]
MSQFDTIIVGAGLLGLSTAYRMQQTGARVVVLDKGSIAYEASSRAMGFLSLRGETPAESRLAQMAEQIWPTLDDELGYPTEWTQKGRIWVAFSDKELVALKTKYASFQKTDIDFRFVDGAQCRDLVPIVSKEAVAAIYTPRSGHANPQRASQAFAWAFEDLGGVILQDTPVYSLLEKAGRIIGVQTSAGVMHADRVILCAGGYNANLMEKLGIVYPVAPVRVESLVTTPLPPMFDMCFVGRGISIRQTKRGNFHIQGGPYEWVDLEADREPAKPITPIIRNIARRAVEAFPMLGGAQMLRTWGGIVDVTPDQMVLIHKFDSPSGLLAASGGGHGFGMAPAIGVVLTELALTGETNAPIEALTLDRFAGLAFGWRQARGWQAGNYNT